MKKNKTLQLALDALEGFIPYLPLKDETQCNRYNKAITALRLAIDVENMVSESTYKEQLETKDDPVAWGMEREDGLILDVISPDEHEREEGGYTVPLYTTPQPKLETKDEPVAWMYWQSCLNDDGTQTSPWVQRYSKFKPTESVINKDITPLYTTPQRTWVGLTKMELVKCGVFPWGNSYQLYEAIEAKLKEKNE